MSRDAAVVPTVNKGLKSPSVLPAPTAAFIDFLTVTFPLDSLVELFGGSRKRVGDLVIVDDSRIVSGLRAQDENAQRVASQVLIDHLGIPVPVNGNRGGFRQFYDHHFKLHTPEGDVCGMVAFGGERQRYTVMLQLTGAGCAHVVAWAAVRDRLESLGAKITRVDVAHDDYEGKHTVDDAVAWHEAGLFTTSGRPPAMQRVGWNDGSGRTVYIGKNTGNQQLVVYEKGREQGARDGDESVNWVRWEARFGAAYRVIPFDVLTEPVRYLVGHYPPLAYWIEAICCRMRTSRERASSNLAHSLRWARRQYGSLLNLLAEHLPEPELFARFVTRHVARKAPPPWLKSNPFGASTIADAVHGHLELAA